MAIKNASDLLVYTKTSAADKQITRIKVLTTTPFSSTGSLKINNVTNASGVVSDGVETGSTSTNTGAACLSIVTTKLQESSNGYTISSTSTSGNYTYADVTNGATGLVPTLEIINGSGTLEDDAVVIEILTPGSSAIFDPVAFSTSASFSTNMDLRDVTTKDSEGWSESVDGLKSFEVSTELLQTLNPDHPIDGTDFINKLKERSLVNVSFSDRIRNILTNNLTTSGQDGFTQQTITQNTGQTDPFGGTNASLNTATATSGSTITNNVSTTRLENKKLSWSFYIKGDGVTTTATFRITSVDSSQFTPRIISGDGAVTKGTTYHSITGLTQNWTRIAVEFTNPVDVSDGVSTVEFRLYPGVYNSQVANTTRIYTSSWQFEHRTSVTDYQDPTTINRWQGDALVTSVSFDAGVEDNLTCSATFTGTATNTYNT